MLLATQYYRPPFPERKYWRDDLAGMRDAGLTGVQLWVIWGWVEAQPGAYDFRDYDELCDEAARVGLKVVLSTKAELQPLWIPRLIPDSFMIDHMGRRVISSNRGECNFGFTPGGCTDNPAVRDRMGAFLGAVAARYASLDALYGWDCWNELRWNVQSDGYVCYCPYTLRAFREWLDRRHGGLAGLNRAWKRRYVSWEDVYPGKLPDRPYTEMIEFCRFLSWRVAEHARFRCDCIRSHDRMHPITAHNGAPSWMLGGSATDQAQCRGNDFDTADQLDGFGCSHFPFWGRQTEDARFSVRVQSTRSAARGKIMWVSELQGGSACDGLCVHPPVDARSQQRWVWNGISHGAKATIFWCWRDEVFGRESSGFGIIGSDGSVEERLAALRETGRVLARCGDRLESYQPDAGEVGLFVEPSNHMIEFARYGHAPLVVASLSAYATALARGNWSFEVVDPGHLDILEHLRLLILPLPLVIREDAAQRIVRFVENGGTLLTEGELDAFSDMGFYRSPGPDRTFATSLGIREVGRRPLLSAELGLTFAGESFCLKPSGWMTPYVEAAGEILGRDAIGWPVAIAQPWGRGRVIALGSFFGKAYEEARYDDFERCLAAVARSAGIRPPLRVESTGKVYWKTGLASGTQGAGRHRLVFLLNPGPCQRAKIAGEAVSLEEFSHAEEVFSGAVIERSDGGFAVELPEKGVALLSCH